MTEEHLASLRRVVENFDHCCWSKAEHVTVLNTLTALRAQLTAAQDLFKSACKTIDDMEARDPDKRIAELEATVNELNSYDVPKEVQELRQELSAAQERIAESESATKSMYEAREMFRRENHEYARRIILAESEAQKLREALEFYANPNVWHPVVVYDNERRQRRTVETMLVSEHDKGWTIAEQALKPAEKGGSHERNRS